PGARLKSTVGNSIEADDDSTSLSVFDLSISDDMTSESGYGLLIPAGHGAPTVSMTRCTIAYNPAGGISVSGGTIRLFRSIIANNAGGGISINSAQFTLVNNF